MRIQKWDLLKFFLMFTVVLGHYVEQYYGESATMRAVFIGIYSFHMPLFIFVAGLFSKRTVNERRWDRVFSFFALYLVTKFALVLSELVIRGESDFQLLEAANVPWFALAIFLFFLITIALKRLPHAYVLVGSIVLAVFMGFDQEVGDWLALTRVVHFFPFFYAGYIMDPAKIVKKTQGRGAKTIALVVLISAAGMLALHSESLEFLRALFTGRNPYSRLDEMSEWGPVLRVIYYPIVALLGLSIIALTPNSVGGVARPVGRFMSWCGQHTLQIYVFHWPIMMIFREVLNGDDLMKAILPQEPYLLLIPVVLITMAICSTKPFEWVLERTANPKFLQERKEPHEPKTQGVHSPTA